MLCDRPSVRPVRRVPRQAACHCFHGRALCLFFFFWKGKIGGQSKGLVFFLFSKRRLHTRVFSLTITIMVLGTETFLEKKAAWQRQTVNGDAYISNGTRRAPKQALRLRFLWRTLSRKTAERWRNGWNAKHKNWLQNAMPPRQAPSMLYIVTRDRCDHARWRNAQVPH